MTIEIKTDRLVLRPLAPEHAEAHVALTAEPDIARFLSPDGAIQPREDRWRQFASYLGHWQIRGYGFFAVEDKNTGDFLGRVGPWMPEGWPGLECGWAISSAFWGQGYAAEAAVASIRWTFRRFADLDRIISIIDPCNTQSEAVAAKVGEHKTGEIFEHWGVAFNIWAAARKDWLERFAEEDAA